MPGLLAQMLIEEGSIDEQAPVSHYLPELKNSGFGDATVRQVLDHLVGLKYSDDFADPKAEIWQYTQVNGMLPRQPGFTGPDNLYEYLATLKKKGEHGEVFDYKDVNTEVAGWLLSRVTGKTTADLASERIWRKLGAERDAYWLVDTASKEVCGAGMGSTVRDLARWGEMMRSGRFNGQQIVSKAVVEKILAGGDPDKFAKGHYGPGLPGWSYRAYWWVHPADGVFMAKGLHGQGIYVNPSAEVVIARNCSHWAPSNSAIDATSLPAYAAVTKLLSGRVGEKIAA
jgi:CubicO group peptidase (beta-lactamase class C family)